MSIQEANQGPLQGLRRWLLEGIWSGPAAARRGPAGWGLRLLRIAVLVVRGFRKHHWPFHAAALTYVTVLSLAPFLAFVFSVAKGFGAYRELRESTIEPFLDSTFGALSDSASADVEAGYVDLRVLAENVLNFVQETNFQTLGLFGLITLIYTVVKMLGGVERSLNEIWEVGSQRSYTRKLIDYVAMVVIVPLVATSITGIGAALRGGGQDGRWRLELDALSGWLPYLAVTAAFGFLYYAMPNTRTRTFPSLVGGAAGAGVWRGIGAVYSTFGLGEKDINPIYVGFAVLPLAMLWIYFSWSAVVLGAEVAASCQLEPALRGAGRIDRTDQAWTERVGLRAAVSIAGDFLAGERAVTLPALAARLGVAERSLKQVLTALERGRVVVRTAGGRYPAYLPSRKPSMIRLSDVLESMRGDSDLEAFPPQTATDVASDTALDAVYGAASRGSANPSLADLVAAAQDGSAEIAAEQD